MERANRTLNAIRPQFGPGIAPRLPRDHSVARLRERGGGAIDWHQAATPFRHLRAAEVFDADTYTGLAAQFRAVLDTTSGVRPGRYRMRPAPGSNDGLILGLTEPLAAAFAPLFTEAWLRDLARLLDLPFVPRIEGALHSNPQGSRTGWIHTDCCSAWFDESRQPADTLILPPRGRCNYFTGKRRTADAEPAEYIRAATLIFYLCNDGWTPGDGGETGLYSRGHESKDTVEVLIPPVNNSLFLFECSPHSYHRFVTNPGRARNSVILWLHAHVDDALARWGDGVHRRDER